MQDDESRIMKLKKDQILSTIQFRPIYDFTACLLTEPYFACQAKKYRSAAKGCPMSVKETQKIQFPMIFPLIPFIFSSGAVMAISGN
jgi:hypothetical protein